MRGIQAGSEAVAKALTASEWARKWGVHRNTARAWLKALHEKYGPTVVGRSGKDGSYRATEEMLRLVAQKPEDALVTHGQLTVALTEVWRALESMRSTAQDVHNTAQSAPPILPK